jgi:hypothetical protein
MLKIVLLFGLKVMFWTPERAAKLKANHWTCTKPPFTLISQCVSILMMSKESFPGKIPASYDR